MKIDSENQFSGKSYFYTIASRIPFTIMFASDNWEWDADMECMTPDTGFRLQYEQSTC